MKIRRLLTAILAFIMTFSMTTMVFANQKFTDVNANDWYNEAVEYVQENGIMGGVSETTFAPNTTMSRAMFATVLWRLEGSPKVETNLTFKDVPKNAWYVEAVKWAVDSNVISGYSTQSFGPNDSVTREQVASLLQRYSVYSGVTTNSTTELNYSDKDQISNWAINAVSWSASNNIMNVKEGNRFDPLTGATRGEVAYALMNYLTNTDIDVNINSNTNNTTETSTSETESKILVVYFSMPETTDPNNMTVDEANSTVVINGEVLGNTQYVASIIQENTNADIFRIEPKVTFTTDHTTLVNLATEQKNSNARPELLNQIDNIEQYDTIFIGNPIWWGDMPMIVYSFLDEYDLSGKKIVPFGTHGGSGLASTISTITELEPNATVIQNGFTVSRDVAENSETSVLNWLSGLGYIN